MKYTAQIAFKRPGDARRIVAGVHTVHLSKVAAEKEAERRATIHRRENPKVQIQTIVRPIRPQLRQPQRRKSIIDGIFGL